MDYDYYDPTDHFEPIRFPEDKQSYGYYKTHKLSNNQTIGIYFWRIIFSKHNVYQVLLLIANKKKHIKQFLLDQKDILTGNQTGKCGLEGLLWAKEQFIEFEESMYTDPGDIIVVYWDDNRRRNVYKYGLTKLGYIIGYIDSRKCLYKKVL